MTAGSRPTTCVAFAEGYLEEIHGLRGRHKADVANLMVDDGRRCGLATRVHADADEAFMSARPRSIRSRTRSATSSAPGMSAPWTR